VKFKKILIFIGGAVLTIVLGFIANYYTNDIGNAVSTFLPSFSTSISVNSSGPTSIDSYSSTLQSSSSLEIVSGNVILINYELFGGTNSLNNKNEYPINLVTQISDPVKEGYSFEGWYDNPNFSGEKVTSINFTNPLKINLYAKWLVNQYTINFITNSESILDSIKIDYNNVIDFPNISRTGYKIDGWFVNQGLSELAPSKMPSKDLTVFAKWKPDEFKINLYQPIEKIIDLSAGYKHTLALTNTGQLYGWGNNEFGQLTFESKDDVLSPVLINLNTFLDENEIIIDVEAGTFSSYIITSKGNLFAWGKNDYGQLGIGDKINRKNPAKITSLSSESDPVVRIITSKAFEEIIPFRNESFVIAQTRSNKIYSWGRNNYGQLGTGNFSDLSSPILVNLNLNNNETIADIALGTSHALLLTNQKRIYAWGRNNRGQLGLNNKDNKNIPTLISGIYIPQVGVINNVEAGHEFSGFIVEASSKNSVYTFGRNRTSFLDNYRLLGLDINDLEITIPTLLQTEINFKSLNLGSEHAIATTVDNKIFSWGRNNFGQLGLNNTNSSKFLSEISFNPAAVSQINQIMVGDFNIFLFQTPIS